MKILADRFFDFYCQDSVICLDEDVMTTPKVAEKSKKSLRSLNDVLGKPSSLCKGMMSPLTSHQISPFCWRLL